MNTSKQINIMVALIFLLLITLGAITIFDPMRQQQARETQTEVLAQNGATTYAANCRQCHGDSGQGRVGPALNRADLRDPNKLDQNWGFVTDTISCGRVGTVMPTWGQANGGPLSDEQIRELVTLITGADPVSQAHEVDPAAAWDNYVAPLSATANAVATPLAVADILAGQATGATASICGQKIASTAAAAPPATPGAPSTSLSETATDDKFSATAFTIPAGQSVTLSFANQGTAIHNLHVTDVKDSSGKDITSSATGTLAGQSVSVTFSVTAAGTYHFQCDFHPTEMLGTLFVAGPGGTVPAAGAATATGTASAAGTASTAGAATATGTASAASATPAAPATATATP